MDPKGQGKALEEGEQRAHNQEDSLKGGQKGQADLTGLPRPQEEGQQLRAPSEKTQGGGLITQDHWEDKLEESAGDTQGGLAE